MYKMVIFNKKKNKKKIKDKLQGIKEILKT